MIGHYKDQISLLIVLTPTIDHIGELKIPISRGVIRKENVISDFYNIQAFRRSSDDEITLFKNGGGAHLDLMTANFILQTWLENN